LQPTALLVAWLIFGALGNADNASPNCQIRDETHFDLIGSLRRDALGRSIEPFTFLRARDRASRRACFHLVSIAADDCDCIYRRLGCGLSVTVRAQRPFGPRTTTDRSLGNGSP